MGKKQIIIGALAIFILIGTSAFVLGADFNKKNIEVRQNAVDLQIPHTNTINSNIINSNAPNYRRIADIQPNSEYTGKITMVSPWMNSDDVIFDFKNIQTKVTTRLKVKIANPRDPQSSAEQTQLVQCLIAAEMNNRAITIDTDADNRVYCVWL